MRITVKRCEVWRGFWWQSLNSDSQRKAAELDIGVPSEPGVGAKCPFCGWRFFAEDRVVPRVFHCACGAELRVKSKRAVRKVKRLYRPKRKVELYCLNCGWEGTWGRAECVRRIREEWTLLCPECHYDLGIEYMEGVPRYVTDPWFR